MTRTRAYVCGRTGFRIVSALVGVAASVSSCASDDFTVSSGDGGVSDAPASFDSEAGGEASSEAGVATDAYCISKFPNAAFCIDFEDDLTTAHEGVLTVTISPPKLDSAGTATLSRPPDVSSGKGALAVTSTATASGSVAAEYFVPFQSPPGAMRARSRFALRIDSYTPSSTDILSVSRVYLRDGAIQVQAELDLMPNGKAALVFRSPAEKYLAQDVGLPVLGKFVAVDLDLSATPPGTATATLRFDGQLVATLSAPQTFKSAVADFIFGLEAPHDAPTRLVLDNFVFDTN